MQSTETTVVEMKTNRDEINNILVLHIQKTFGVKIESVSDEDDEGVIIIKGSKSKELAELMSNSSNVDLAQSILRNSRGKTGRTMRNAGVGKFIEAELKNHKGNKEGVHVNYLLDLAAKNGFEIKYKSNLVAMLKKSAKFKDTVIEVSEDMYRLKD